MSLEQSDSSVPTSSVEDEADESINHDKTGQAIAKSDSVEVAVKPKSTRTRSKPGSAKHYLKRPKRGRPVCVGQSSRDDATPNIDAEDHHSPDHDSQNDGTESDGTQDSDMDMDCGNRDLDEDYVDVIYNILPSNPSEASSEVTMTESSIPSEPNELDDTDNPSVKLNPKTIQKPTKRRRKISTPKKKRKVANTSNDPTMEDDEGNSNTKPDIATAVRCHLILKDSLEPNDVSKESLPMMANYLQETLADNWAVATSGDIIFLSRISNPSNPIVERSIIWRDNSIKFLVHNRQLPASHPLWQISSCESQNCLKIADHLISVSQDFLNYEVCSGVVSHDHLWQKFLEKGSIDTLSLPCFRTNDCSLLLSMPGKCSTCRQFQKKLFEHERQKARTAARQNTDQTKVNNKYLQAEEIIKKMERIQKEKKLSQQTVKRLTKKINKMIKRNAELIDKQLSEDFAHVMNDNADKMTEVEKLFWKQQSLALSKRGKSKTMRWHPAMIRLALHLRTLSPAAFDFMSGIISLPSERRLFDFSHFTEIKEGINADILNQFKLRFDKNCTEDHQKYFTMLLDEMNVRSDLVYDARSGELVGFTNLTSLEEELSSLEAEIQGKDHEKNFAKKVLVFMLSGCTTNERCVAAIFTTDNLTAAQLYVRAWDVIYCVEEIGVKVLAVVCDGASVNRKYMRLHFDMGDKDFTFITVNSASGEERPMFFMLDPPHLIKTFRNCVANSHCHRNSRSLWNNGQNLSWKAIEALFELCVFSYSVAEALDKYKDVSPVKEACCEELIAFIRLVNRCFDCLNGGERSTKKTMNSDLLEYSLPSDPRLNFLVEDFLGYLKNWEISVANRPGNYTKDQRSRMIISHQSLEGMKITISSFTEIVKFLLDKGAPFVSSRKFNQDPLEQRFSDYRRARGADTNPTVKQVLHTETSLFTQGQMMSTSKRGNTEARRNAMEVDCTPLPVKRRKEM